MRRIAGVCLVVSLALVGCHRKQVGEYDTSTPEKTIDSVAQMVKDGHAELIPQMVFVKARDVTFDDGVTEASAINDVKGKAGEMLQRLWRVSQKIRKRWPKQVDKELSAASKASGLEDVVTRIVADPFAALDSQRDKLKAEDMSDGTAALLWDGEPILGGILTMIETPDGWRLNVPMELVRENKYWPDTRYEWAVVASMMLGIENSLKDFEKELDSGKFKDLPQASARVGRLVGESVVAQSVIYALMRRDPPAAKGSPAAPASR